MSKRAEAKAMEAYPPTYTTVKRHAKRVQSERTDTHQPVRAIFQQGYEQTEKDLALTLEQVVKLDRIIVNMVVEGYNDGYKTRQFYEEVLRRFLKRRGEA